MIISTINVLFCFFRTFAPKTLQFLLSRGTKIFLAQGAGYPSYATAGQM